MRGLEKFDPLDTEETIYPFAIDKNVCGLDRAGRVIGAFVFLLMSVKLAVKGKYLPALAVLVGAGALALNALTQRCILSEVVDVDTCGED